MSEKELQRLVEEISLIFFNRPFRHQASFNSRLKTTGGRYHLNDHQLDFNPKVLEKYGMDELVGVIKHELCHYHLHQLNQGYQHKDYDFKALLKATGGSRYVRSLVDERKYHEYQCLNCHQKVKRQRKINLKKFGCLCGGPLELLTNGT